MAESPYNIRMFIRIFYGLLLIAGGVLILKYRKIVYEWTGSWYWAEKYLGRGGTIVALCLIAMAMMGFGTAYMFGTFDHPPQNGTDRQFPLTSPSQE